MLWEYPTFVTLPCTIAGAALWYLGSTRTRTLWTALAAGICLSAAVYANEGAGVFLLALIGVEAIAAIRAGRRDVIMLVRRGCVMAVGALLVLAVGYLGYRAYIGSFPLKLMFQSTISSIRANSQIAPNYQVPLSTVLRTDPHIYAPVLVCVGTAMVLGRSLLSNTFRGRMAQFAVASTLVFWVWRLAVPSAVVEVWWYYNLTAVTGAFAMPAILDEFGRRSGRTKWLQIAGLAIAATGLIDLVIRSISGSALSVFYRHTVVLVFVLIASCLAAVLVAALKRNSARLIALAVFCAIVAAIAVAPDKGGVGTGQFSTYGTTAEFEELPGRLRHDSVGRQVRPSVLASAALGRYDRLRQRWVGGHSR